MTKKLSQLPVATVVNPTDKLLTTQGGVSKQADQSLVAPASGGGLLGAPLWVWDKATLDGIDATAIDYDDDFGTATKNAATALILDVHALGGIYGNVLRVVATSLEGGGIFRIANTVALPDSYVIQCRVVHVVGTSGSFESHPIVPMYNDDAANVQALMWERKVGVSNGPIEMVVNDIHEHGLTVNGSGNPTQDKIDTGGVLMTCTVHKRQAGETPSRIVLATLDESWGGTTNSPIHDGNIPSDDADVNTQWDGIDLDKCGFGAVDASSVGISGTFYIASIGVYERPAL